jgi:8-oxo-dGTP pyrophosphatase MutT (NUDIX family)
VKEAEPRGEQPTQSAALPFRLAGGRVEVMLVTPRGGSGWIIPKGKIEARLGPAQSARQEAVEEAGVRGDVDPAPFDQYRHGGGDDGPLVVVFLMRVTREMSSWREAHQRERRWATFEEVERLVIDPGLARVIREAAPRLATLDAAAWEAATHAGTTARHAMRRRLVGSAILLAAAIGVATVAAFAG